MLASRQMCHPLLLWFDFLCNPHPFSFLPFPPFPFSLICDLVLFPYLLPYLFSHTSFLPLHHLALFFLSFNPSTALSLHTTHHHHPPKLYFIENINSGVFGDKCATVFLPRISPADLNLFSLLIQCGWSEWDSVLCLCVYVHARWRWCLCVCKCVWEREEETLGVCASHCMDLLYWMWISWLRMRVISLIRQIGVEAMRGERCGLGRRSEAHLMPVCINAVWHLSARDTHTQWRAEILWQCVCERVCTEVTVPVAKLTAYKLISFFFLHSCATWYTSYFFYRASCQTLEVSSSLSLVILPSLLSSCSHCHYVCDLCPCKLDSFPGFSNQMIGIHIWIPLYAKKFPEKSSFT